MQTNKEWPLILVALTAFWVAFIGLLFNATLPPSNKQKLDNIVKELTVENVR